jgi:2,4-didehydro-3-deoxy-L-rhamnonate hydrolase
MKLLRYGLLGQERPGRLRASYVEQPEALDHVAGYCVVNDVSEREYQIERGGTWDKVKGCDTFSPTLQPGDIVTTGTLPGVGMGIKPQPVFLKPGDVMTLGIEGLGEQRQEVIAWQRAGGGPSNGL